MEEDVRPSEMCDGWVPGDRARAHDGRVLEVRRAVVRPNGGATNRACDGYATISARLVMNDQVLCVLIPMPWNVCGGGLADQR